MTAAVILIIAIVLLASAAAASAAPWLPTYNKDIGRILKAAGLKPGQKFVDLGCGDGRLIVAAGREGAEALGYELSLLPYAMGRARMFLSRSSAKMAFGDFFRKDLSEADVVYMFLTPPVMAKIGAKLRNELKPGAKAISYHFPIPGWEAAAVDKDPDGAAIYAYAA